MASRAAARAGDDAAPAGRSLGEGTTIGGWRGLSALFLFPGSKMAQYVFTMNRVGKIVPPKSQILRDVSLSFFPGAKIGVLGLNGSGKSTLLKIMAGLDNEIEGEAPPMPNLRIGYLPQEPQLDPEQTVR